MADPFPVIPAATATGRQTVTGLLEMDDAMDRYECTVCGYIYNPEAGDPVGGIPPGTQFSDLPDDWVHPECGVGKDQFIKFEIVKRQSRRRSTAPT